MQEQDNRSTLARGDEIEADFYTLKAQEWAVSREQAKAIISAAMLGISQALKEQR